MIRKEEVYKIGIFNKPHGIHGELSFTFTDDIFDRVEAEYLICLLDGIFVPFFIEEYRFRSDTTALVKLEGVDTAERARMFTNIEVYFPVKHAEEAGPGELSWDFFVGFRMEEAHHGKLGEVTDVDTSTINTLFVVDYKGEELLIPAQEDFIMDIDQKHILDENKNLAEIPLTDMLPVEHPIKCKLISAFEVFVRVPQTENYWISNYGRGVNKAVKCKVQSINRKVYK
jgi:16S rRNA processing protein RimM